MQIVAVVVLKGEDERSCQDAVVTDFELLLKLEEVRAFYSLLQWVIPESHVVQSVSICCTSRCRQQINFRVVLKSVHDARHEQK